MISPELLRKYPFFGTLDNGHLREIAMISEEESYEQGATIFKEKEAANYFYLLMEGSIDLFFSVQDELMPEKSRDLLVGEINPGEPFGISSLIEPYMLSSTAKGAQKGRYIKIEAGGLRSLCERDCQFCYRFMHKIAQAAMERLYFTRIQLAATRV